MAWPEKKTAILIIHGVGQQSSFDTLDKFTSNLSSALEAEHGPNSVSLSHRLTRHGSWAQNYISIALSGNESNSIDCYEYYWAFEAQRKIDIAEVFDWLVETGEKAQEHYSENRTLVAKYGSGKSTPFNKQGQFDKYWYLKHAGTILQAVRRLASAIPLAYKIPGYGVVIKGVLGLLRKIFRPLIVDVIGDLAIYTSTDMKSEYFPVRQRILDGAVNSIESLLDSTDPSYGQVIVAGHSLGSVIGYDALNRVNNRMNAGIKSSRLAPKVTGFVTFGSPLDKIAFFIRRRGKKNQEILRQILGQNYSFKSRSLNPDWIPSKTLDSKIEAYLDEHVRWLNFWDSKDPISGPLDFYEVLEGDNRELDLDARWGWAHTAYWEEQKMYQGIIKDLLSRKMAEVSGESPVSP